MSKYVYDTALDALLNQITGATELYVCAGDPADRAAARTSALSGVTGTNGTTETPPTTTGPEDHTPNGRRITWNQKTGITIVTAGDAATICLCDGSVLRAKTDLAQTVTVAINDTVDLGSFIHSVGDVT